MYFELKILIEIKAIRPLWKKNPVEIAISDYLECHKLLQLISP